MSCIEYKPVVGMTIMEALSNAVAKADMYGKNVLADINDIVMVIKPHSNLKKIVKDYRQKLKFKYEINDIKRAQTRAR